MVSMRYARHLVLGHGLVWNAGGERVQGYSNLGITLIMAAVHWLVADRTKTSLAVQLLNAGGLVYIVLASRSVARYLFGHAPSADAAAYGIMACAPLAILGLQGTDVVATSAIVLGSLRAIACAAENGRRWPDRVYILLAAGILVRLDFVLIYCAFAAASLGFDRSRWSLPIAAVVLAGATLSILGWQWWYYGDPLPNTYYLKLTGQPLSLMLRHGLLTQLEFLLNGAVGFGAAIVVLAKYQRQDRGIWLLGGLIATFMAYNVRTGGDWVEDVGYTSRMLAPALPLIIVGMAGAWRHIGERLGQRTTAGLALMAVLSGVSTGSETALLEWINPRHEPLLREDNLVNVERAFYFARHTRPDTTLAVHYAGMTPYFLDRAAMDVLGKTDAHIARLDVARFYAGHSKWDWDYTLARRPDLLDLESRGLAALPEFAAHYRAVETADGLRFFQRVDTAGKLTDPALRVFPSAPE